MSQSSATHAVPAPAASGITNHNEFSAFGQTVSQTNASVGGGVLYASMWFSTGVGDYMTPNRDYDPATARWFQQDPIMFAAGDSSLA